jgi:outer membrane protein OmpA-like peptidoglycan-associated protein
VVGLLLGAAGMPAVANATSWRIPEFMIYFSPGSAALSPAATSVVQDAKAYFDESRTDPKSRNMWCHIMGGVDGAEFSKGLQHLALERAASVGRALEDLGLAPGDRFLTRRTGPAPFAPSQPGGAEDFNRAVVITLYSGMAPIGNSSKATAGALANCLATRAPA